MAETRVENILATIREAIDKGPDAPAPAPSVAQRPSYTPPPPPLAPSQTALSRNDQGTLMRGALREMHVSYGVEGERDLQLSELRERVQRSAYDNAAYSGQNYQTNFELPTSTRHEEPPVDLRTTIVEREDGFSGILTGRLPRAEPPPPPPPQQRAPSYAYQRPRYQPEEEYAPRQPVEHQEHYASDQHYEQPYDDQYADHYAAQGWQEQEHYAPPPPRQRHAPAPRAPRKSATALISARAESASRASFDELADVIMARAGGDRGIEDLTRDLLRGLLRNWLDEHLPQMVEQLVREEIERVARGR